MLGFLAALAAAPFFMLGSALPMADQVHPVANDYTVSHNTTFNSTSEHNTDRPVAQNSPPSPLPLNLVNNLGAGNINAYLTGLDGDGVAFFLQSDGTPYYPPNPQSGIPPTTITHNIAIPLAGQGQAVTVNLPNYVTSGRIYFSVGTMSFAVNHGDNGPEVVAPSFSNPSDPSADVDYGFIEFTWNAEEIYSNLSYVDFIGLVISQTLQSSTQTCKVRGLPNGAVDTICNSLNAQAAKDGQPWGRSCQQDGSGKNLRVLAPLHLQEVDQGALTNYYSSYIDQVWDTYTNKKLTVSADSAGTFTGQVVNGQLTFDSGDSFAKPTATDIFGCNSGSLSNSGPASRLAIYPRLCAAFDRSTFLVAGGDNQPNGPPISSYYPNDGTPTNWYSAFVHANELDGKGYAFAYDDVKPDNAADVSGACQDPNPSSMTFYVGGN